MSSHKVDLFPWLSRLFRHRPRPARGASAAWQPRFESLEGRQLLTACSESPAIQGTVFLDLNQNGQPDTGEPVAGATVQLIRDDGDGILETNGDDVQVGADQLTNSSGDYCFDNLLGTAAYFVRQPSQTVGSTSLPLQVSPLIRPGSVNLVIDQFQTSQTVEASPPPPSSQSNTLAFPNQNEVIGAERDLFVELTSGASEVRLRVNPFGLLPVLQFDATSGVQGRSLVTWDGPDGDGNPVPTMGLGGRDLTEAGQNVGFAMNLGIDPSGAGERITILLYQGNASNVSTATAAIPVTDGTATEFLFVPFSSFVGPVSPNSVDAIQLQVGNGVASADGQIDVIGIVGPKVHNFANNAAAADLAITKTDGLTSVVPGQTLTYTITVRNNGPSDVQGASVQDVFPASLTNVSYTSTPTGNVTGHTAAGTGDINDTLNMAAGASLVYTVTATVIVSAQGTLSNTATVTPPEGVTDPVPGNNNAVDVNTIAPQVDLSITKSDGVTQVAPGSLLTYTIVVTNAGPSTAQGARVVDTFPAQLGNVSYTSSVSGSASGNTASGTGNIDDTVNLPVGSSITYTVLATVNLGAVGTIANTAVVTAPDNTTDIDLTNNQATDTTQITSQADLAITKTDGQTSAVPGQTITYTIQVQNLGPSSVTGATVQDVFPAALTNVTYVSVVIGSASGNTASGLGNINDVVNMAADSSITYTVTAIISPGATGQLSNTATVTAPSGVIDPNLTNNQATDTTQITNQTDLAITKTDGQTSAVPGQTITYTIQVQNLGPNSVTGATVQDIFPAALTNVTYVSVVTGSASGNTASDLGNINDVVMMAADSSITYTVTAIISPGATGQLSNTATVTAPSGVIDPNLTNNQATDTNTLTPRVDLVITKTNNQATAIPNQPLTYTITVTNVGPSHVVGARVVDTFPNELTGVSYTSSAQGGATGNTVSGTGNLNETVNLPVGSSIVYSVTSTVRTDAMQDVTNTATVTPPEGVTETVPADNSATHTDDLIPGVDLSVTKTASAARFTAGQTLTYAIVVRNNGPNPVIGAQVTDVFPSLLTNVTYTSQASAGASGNTPSGSGNLNETLNLAAGSSVTYTVTAGIPTTASGSLSNTATVTAPGTVTELNTTNNADTEAVLIDALFSSIAGFVYVDLDFDGVRDANEPGIAGVQMLLERNGAVQKQTTTDSSGAFDLDDLVAGSYRVRQIQPTGYRDGQESIGSGNNSGTVTIEANDTFFVALGAGQNVNGLYFGELPLQPSKRELLASSFAADPAALARSRRALINS